MRRLNAAYGSFYHAWEVCQYFSCFRRLFQRKMERGEDAILCRDKGVKISTT